MIINNICKLTSSFFFKNKSTTHVKTSPLCWLCPNILLWSHIASFYFILLFYPSLPVVPWNLTWLFMEKLFHRKLIPRLTSSPYVVHLLVFTQSQSSFHTCFQVSTLIRYTQTFCGSPQHTIVFLFTPLLTIR